MGLVVGVVGEGGEGDEEGVGVGVGVVAGVGDGAEDALEFSKRRDECHCARFEKLRRGPFGWIGALRGAEHASGRLRSLRLSGRLTCDLVGGVAAGARALSGRA